MKQAFLIFVLLNCPTFSFAEYSFNRIGFGYSKDSIEILDFDSEGYSISFGVTREFSKEIILASSASYTYVEYGDALDEGTYDTTDLTFGFGKYFQITDGGGKLLLLAKAASIEEEARLNAVTVRGEDTGAVLNALVISPISPRLDILAGLTHTELGELSTYGSLGISFDVSKMIAIEFSYNGNSDFSSLGVDLVIK